jgi:hypothetical protein
LSQINTNGIDTNYPVPGTNNSTQGLRNNFTQIKNNLDTASNELSDLQGKVILKAALDNSVLDNNMSGQIISNVKTKGFRGSTYNLGSSLAGVVNIDVNKADVHYGVVDGNVTIRFINWAPTDTESQVRLSLEIANTAAAITFPSEVIADSNFGSALLENVEITGNTAVITATSDSNVVDYTFTSLDCGETITVTPNNRPYKTTQVVTRTPTQIGEQGDKAGTVAVDEDYIYVCTGDYDGVANIWKRAPLSW